jgi:D-galacturonate reductase
MGVVALTFFDLRARGLVGPRIALCGRRASRAPLIRAHFDATIAKYGLDVSCDIYPTADSGAANPATAAATPSASPAQSQPRAEPHEALLSADGPFRAGDLAVITTPDDTHASLALACIERGVHCIIAKPVVQSLEQHWALLRAAESWDARASSIASSSGLSPPPRPLVVCGEFHKRFDPLYADAASRVSRGTLGDLSYFHAYMSQPKSQLNTFRAWLLGGSGTTSSSKSSSGGAGNATPARAAPSDISFYLNSHHMDLLHLATSARSRPLWVTAIAARGCANALLSSSGSGSSDAKAKVDIEDTITVTVQYVHDGPKPGGAAAAAAAVVNEQEEAEEEQELGYGIGVFTSSWVAPRGPVHTQQRFHFLGTEGEVSVDQANRGYTMAKDSSSNSNNGGGQREVMSLNPLFMRYEPSSTDGSFVGQQGYGYRSFEHFVEAATGRRHTGLAPLARIGDHATLFTTAVLEAARRSLDEDNRKVRLVYDEQRRPMRVE